MRLFLFASFSLSFGLLAATLTATIKPSTVNLGNSATLTLRCEGGAASTVEQTSTPKSLALSFVSSGKEFSLNNGQRTINSTFTYHVTPRVAGRFAIPPFKTMIAGKEIRSEALTLTVLDKNGNNTPQNIAKSPPPALLRVNTPVKKVYVGEVFPVSMELLAQGLRQNHLPVPQLITEGIRFTRIRPQYRQSSQRTIDGILYQNVFLFDTGAIAMKPGNLNVLFELEVTVMDYRQDVFGRQRKLHLTSDPITLEVAPLPKEGQPEHFSGTVGQFQMTASAKPNRVEVGEPIELSVTLSGQGTLDNTPIPNADSWEGFKTHPPTSEVQYTDTRHLNSRKTFQRMIIPTQSTLSHIPALKFSYFNPRTKKYVTLNSPSTPLEVTGSRMPASPAGDPPGPQGIQTSEDIPKIRMIKDTPGHLADIQPPLIIQPWFLAIPATGLLAFFTAFAYRKRAEYLETHPEVARRLHVERVTRKTMRTLNSSDSRNDPSTFSANVQLILREHIGMAINRPAQGITLQTVEESDLRLPSESQKSLERLFQLDELTRFAGSSSQLDQKSALQDLSRVLRDLK